ncbi:MAG: DUF2849 domain-containing protein [Rhodobiaceae bacterium]|nr:DUF2849 domain-containing protein [Rhodobiaceae bacterium]MCC0011925.1 DUF2849 domain-containing protein [Rhodobiaceae bacterium]MCC0018575.1 DUF2849 domain-containing protein [Rhodobiaceae bacterium]MCC0050420.1 DUF2849 domain-containing protein [Rhodobiaceae bacterium]MCC0061159.1 DUF2849 domain-containing protein [Rhodobiaceae bacterium]
MARVFAPKIATANDLLEGDVVYFTANGVWSRLHGDAKVAHSPEEADTLLKAAEAFPLQVVGVYLADVALSESGAPQPVHFRETFRTRGPSNYFHGKQAVLSHV